MIYRLWASKIDIDKDVEIFNRRYFRNGFRMLWLEIYLLRVTVGVVLKIFVALRKSGIFQTKLDGCDEIFLTIDELTVA